MTRLQLQFGAPLLVDLKVKCEGLACFQLSKAEDFKDLLSVLTEELNVDHTDDTILEDFCNRVQFLQQVWSVGQSSNALQNNKIITV